MNREKEHLIIIVNWLSRQMVRHLNERDRERKELSMSDSTRKPRFKEAGFDPTFSLQCSISPTSSVCNESRTDRQRATDDSVTTIVPLSGTSAIEGVNVPTIVLGGYSTPPQPIAYKTKRI